MVSTENQPTSAARSCMDFLRSKAVREKFRVFMLDDLDEAKKVSSEEMIKLYKEGWSMSKIGKKLGFSPSGVKQRIVKAGCPLRENRYAHKTLPDDIGEQIDKMRKAGMTCTAIAEKIGISRPYVTLKHKQFLEKQ